MKAILRDVYGGPEVVRWAEAAERQPGAGEVLIRVKAASVNAADLHLLRGSPWVARLAFGLFKPKSKLLGADVAGTVEAVGPGVRQFRPGDAVFGDLSGSGFGAYAELAVAPEKILVPVPSGISFEQAASAPMAAVTALQAFGGKSGLTAGQQVLVTGASGGVGSFAVQIARALGAVVTAVTSTPHVGKVSELGAADVIDRNNEDFRSRHGAFDVVIDTAGRGSLRQATRVLRPNGRYVLVGGDGRSTMTAMLSGKGMLAKASAEDLQVIADFMSEGSVTPLIGGTHSIAQTAEAMRRFESGNFAGKLVVVDMADSAKNPQRQNDSVLANGSE